MNTEQNPNELPETVQHVTADGRTLEIPNVERLREETDGTDKYDGPETFHYWELSLGGFPGESLYSNPDWSEGNELHTTTEEERIAFEVVGNYPYFLLEWDSQGFVSGHFVNEKQAHYLRERAEENNGPQEGDYTLGDARGGGTSAGIVNGEHLGTFRGEDKEREALNAIREDASASQVWPNVWRIDDHGGATLLRDWSWEVELSDSERFVAAFERETKGLEALSVGACPGCSTCRDASGEYKVLEYWASDADDAPQVYTFKARKGETYASEDAAETAAAEAFDDDVRNGHVSEEPSFSWSRCDTCGSSLGGDRHPAHCFLSKDDKEVSHLSVCSDCLFYIANGDLPETWK